MDVLSIRYRLYSIHHYFIFSILHIFPHRLKNHPFSYTYTLTNTHANTNSQYILIYSIEFRSLYNEIYSLSRYCRSVISIEVSIGYTYTTSTRKILVRNHRSGILLREVSPPFAKSKSSGIK